MSSKGFTLIELLIIIIIISIAGYMAMFNLANWNFMVLL